MTAAWINGIRQSLQTIEYDGDHREFFRRHYQANLPAILELPPWNTSRWSVDGLLERIGSETPVEIQAGRATDPDYELRSYSLKSTVPFGSFVEMMQDGAGNDVYLTAQNTGANQAALAGIWQDVGPLPGFLRPEPEAGFFWLGRDTVTPLHHDETNNLMCQVQGTKHIRIFSPDQRDKLDHRIGVHSSLGWVTDDMVIDRDLSVIDVWLNPGQALFLPIGWWHCVRSHGIALTLVYTSFIWQNFWGRVTD